MVGAIGHDFYDGERDGPRGFPRFTDPRLRGPDQYASYLRRAAELSLERLGLDELRPPAAAQPRPHRLHQRGRLGRDVRAARRRPHAHDRRGPRPRQRLHARPDRLPGALRRPHRLGDGDPQPARAVAGRAGAAGRRARRRARAHARGGLRRAAVGRPRSRPRVPPLRPPRLSPRGLGGARAGADRGDAPDRRAPRAHAAAAGVPVEPRARGRGVLRAHADPGERGRMRARWRTSGRSWRPRPPRWC